MTKAAHDLPKRMDCDRADRPLRIALVYSRLPFPMMRGDQLTVAHLLSFFGARGHAVDFYTLDMQGAMSPVQRAWLEDACAQVRIYTQGWWSRLSGLARGLLKGQPLQVGLFQNAQLTRDLHAQAAAGEYDVIYSYYMRSAPTIPSHLGRDRARPEAAADGTPATFLALQLSQSLNTRRIWKNEKNLLKRLFYRIETGLCEAYEARVWQRFTRSVLIGPADVAAIKAVCALRNEPAIDNWVYGAHGTDIGRYPPARPDEIVPGRVVFSGSMLYQPNVQAVHWFVDHCWPRVRERIPDATLIIQGRDPLASIRALDGTQGISVTGTVPDIGIVVRSAAVCINPMGAAGGMQNKLIEYMASAKAIVATPIANEGIMAPADTLRLADGADAFADGVIDLLDHPDEALALGQRARAHVVENWTWEAHFLKLEQEFLKALGHVAHPRPRLRTSAAV
ncbi:glycosyltransferase family 4 protein [Sphingobium aquiterrae]|uniref:glycosyltransferase n=1 Tax=Sphingobium aquiterrae TaxID=2038656 RepID=UPI003019FF91